MSGTGVGKEDAQAFVQSLKTFNDALPPEQQALLGTILDAAQQDETAGYGRRAIKRNESDPTAEDDETAGYGRRFGREADQTAEDDETAGFSRNRPRSETDQTAGEDETAGYAGRRPRSDTPSQDDRGRWEGLVEWLSASKGDEDETEGFGRNRP